MARYRTHFSLAGLVVAALVVLGYNLVRLNQGPGEASVIRVVDGDTLKIQYQGRPESIRLVGIDTPESRANQKARRDVRKTGRSLRKTLLLGQQAKYFVQGLVKPGTRLKLEFDVQKRDKYGRMLGYAYLPDGRMLNEVIIRSGYASPMTIPPNVKYQERFLKAYRRARSEGAGLWKE